jgi:hypothetical protein
MRSSCLSILILLASVLSIHATTVKRMDLDTLVSGAHEIVVGKVRGSETYWSEDGRLILTRDKIEVSETLKGVNDGTVEITTIGGTIGDLTLYVAGMSVFKSGEEMIVFVEVAGSFRTVVGLGQGKFSVADDFVPNSVSSLNFAHAGPGRVTRMRFARLKNAIRERLQTENVR